MGFTIPAIREIGCRVYEELIHKCHGTIGSVDSVECLLHNHRQVSMGMDVNIGVNDARHVSETNGFRTLFSSSTATMEHVHGVSELAMMVLAIVSETNEQHRRCGRISVGKTQLLRNKVGDVDSFLPSYKCDSRGCHG